MLSVKQCGIKYYFLSLGMTRPGIEPKSPGVLANTLTIMPTLIKIIIIDSWEFITSVLAGGFSLEFERQEVSSRLHDSSQYSGCC